MVSYRMSERTIFEKILAKEMAADVVYEDRYVLAFRDINPVAAVHVLVIPKRKVESLDDVSQLDAKYTTAFFRSLPQIAARCGLENGYRVVINNGRHGQQTVPYLHAHIIGGRQLIWPPG